MGQQPWHFGDPAAANQILDVLAVDDMPGREFESFVATLLASTGFEVEAVGGSGDLGVDLVARSEPIDFTVQVKRYSSDDAVSRSAVSDAVAGREHYGTEHAAVITNTTFSADAQKLAQGRCYLIDRSLLGSWAATQRDALFDDPRRAALEGLSGAAFESFLAELLRGRGWRVEQVGGSGDLGVDLVLGTGHDRVAVQAKRYASAVSRRAVTDAVAGADYYDCGDAWVVTTAPRFTSGARELAESSEARLVDREELLDWVEESDVTLPVERNASDMLEDPAALAERLEWADQIMGVSLGEATFDVTQGQIGTILSSVFQREIEGEMTLSYSGVPDETWLGIGFPGHELLSFSPRDRRGLVRGDAVAVPLTGGSGKVAVDLTAELPSGEGIEGGMDAVLEAVETLAGDGMIAAFYSGEPGDEHLERLDERA